MGHAQKQMPNQVAVDITRRKIVAQGFQFGPDSRLLLDVFLVREQRPRHVRQRDLHLEESVEPRLAGVHLRLEFQPPGSGHLHLCGMTTRQAGQGVVEVSLRQTEAGEQARELVHETLNCSVEPRS